MKKTLILFSLFFIALHVQAQSVSDENQFILKEVDWTFNVPAGFILKDSGTTTQQMGNNIELWRRRFFFKNDKNTFAFSIIKFSYQTEGGWEQTYQTERNRSFQIITKQKPMLKIDSLTTLTFIGDLGFNKFTMKGKENNEIVFNQVQLSKHYKGYYFQLTYISTDPTIIEEIEKALKNSKFN